MACTQLEARDQARLVDAVHVSSADRGKEVVRRRMESDFMGKIENAYSHLPTLD
jgi:hypothetical protein